MIGAFVIGGVMAVAGLIALVVGTPVKEFSLGNTLLLSGAIFIAGGLMLIAFGLMGRELKLALTGGEASPQPRKLALPVEGGEAGAGPDPSAAAAAEPSPARPHAGDAAPPAAAPPPVEPPKPKRNLLFASTSRRERERAERQVDPTFAATAAKPEPSPPPAPRESRGSAFDEAWPEPERAQGSARRSRPATEPVAAPPSPPPPPTPPVEPAAPQVTVLKEGVVDGMAYKLFSDGSMEAQLPEGTMRFASLDELRNYLEQRG